MDLAGTLARHGHEVTVASSAGGLLARELTRRHVHVNVLCRKRVKRRLSLVYAWRLRALISRQDFDLVHAHIYASAAAAMLATFGMRSRFVVTVHSEAAWEGWFSRRVSRLVYRRADRVIAVCGKIQQRLFVKYGIDRRKVITIPNAVPPAAKSPSIRRRSPSKEHRVGVVARLEPEKGVDVFLEAIARLPSDQVHAQFLIVGDGTHRPELERQVQRLNLEDRVQFLGACDCARRLLDTLDLLVVPSRTEGAPLIVLEAMTHGVPIVASRAGSIHEQIRDEIEGLLVTPGDPGELAAAINRLLLEPDLACNLALSAFKRVASEFPYERMIEQVEETYAAASERGVASGHFDSGAIELFGKSS